MTQPVDPGRLTELRKRMALTQEGLAKRAGLRKETVHRLERGRQSGNRQKTLEGLCKALGVDTDILSGQTPLPPSEQQMDEPADGSRYQLNVRLDGDIRNAFSLVALRYKIPMSRIVELAPLLFVLAAERSLDRRRAKLTELETLFAQGDKLCSEFPHLPNSIAPCFEAYDAISEESASIDSLDIFGRAISGDIFRGFDPVQGQYDPAEHNPFVLFLKEEVAERLDIAEIKYLDHRGWTSYRICQEDALALTGGDEELAGRILQGFVLLNEMPRELLENGATAARAQWLRAKLEEVLEEEREASEKFDPQKFEEDLQEAMTNSGQEGAQL